MLAVCLFRAVFLNSYLTTFITLFADFTLKTSLTPFSVCNTPCCFPALKVPSAPLCQSEQVAYFGRRGPDMTPHGTKNRAEDWWSTLPEGASAGVESTQLHNVGEARVSPPVANRTVSHAGQNWPPAKARSIPPLYQTAQKCHYCQGFSLSG